MEENYEKLARFFAACDELVEGKFLVADTKISELLKALADCRPLTEIFNAVTTDFDYAAAKRAYLKYPAESSVHGAAYLPTERTQILAFVFCLLVEFDGGSMKLNDFLLRYFYEDGSYTASYALFASRMIRPFRDIVRDCFPDFGKDAHLARQKMREEAFVALATEIEREQRRIQGLPLHDEERRAARVLLSELASATDRREVMDLEAILTGYRYFLRYINAEKDGAAIFTAAERLK